MTPHLSRGELRDLGFQLIVCPLAALYAATKAAQRVLAELKDLGFQLIVCPLAALYAATKAAIKVLTELKEHETTAALYDELTTFDEFGELVELEKRYADETKYTS